MRRARIRGFLLLLVAAGLAGSVGVALLASARAASSSAAASEAALGSMLNLQAIFVTDGLGLTMCPGTPPATDCYEQTAHATVRGLGATTLTGFLVVDQSQMGCEHLKLEGSLATGEGAASYTATSSGRCIQLHLPSKVDYTFMGGAGAFASAAGTGTITLAFVSTKSGDSMKYAWNGVFSVPGYSFDTTPPRFSGIYNRRVIVGRHARRARVRYVVTAIDAIDGPVRVRCRPVSGAWFPLGRSTVRCNASDTHANVVKAQFRVAVAHRG